MATDKLEKRITRGFQYLSGYHNGTIGKSGYQELYETVEEKDWKSDDFFDAAGAMKTLLFSCDYFTILKPWILFLKPWVLIKNHGYQF